MRFRETNRRYQERTLSMNLTEEERERAKVLLNEIRILEDRKQRLLELLLPIQQKCDHSEVKWASKEDFVLKYKGVCPECGEVILSMNIINMIRGQHVPKE